MANYIQKIIDTLGKSHEERHWSQFHNNSNIEKYSGAC
jgi:hypothetical protein